MSGAGLPYRLRPHKAVDRRIFLEVLNRCARHFDLATYVYVSMAASSLEDHKLVHRLLGVTRLLAFDMNEGVVARQKFNRPIEECRCVAMKSGDLVADVSGVLEKAGIDDADGYIVWLDYTAPKDLPTQIGEFQKLVAQCRSGDIVRVTVNAEFGYWGGPERVGGKPVQLVERQVEAHKRLNDKLGGFISPDLKPDQLDEAGDGLAKALSRAFGRAANQAVPSTSGLRVEPISITRYADGQQMLSMTSIVIRSNERDEVRTRLDLAHWPFASVEWRDVKFLAVPDLTIRERLHLERNVQKPASDIAKSVGFDFDEVTETPGFLENFRKYYRYYPAFTAVEI